MELARSTSHGGLSLRRIFIFALAVLFTALLWTISASPATHAADASWSGSAIVYEGDRYIATTDEQILEDVGLESASKVFVFVDPAQTRGDPSSTNGTSPPTDRKIRLIYFEANTDPTTATEAKYKDFTYVTQGNYTNPSAVTSITFSQTGGEGTTSCDIDTGLGYIICPVTTTLAGAMDFIFDVLTGFLEVRPIETGQDSALYRAWKFMQAFANVAFVIVFLVIIYSQLTGAGISSYGLKKLLPRLIIAALLVNLSYFISSIAVDISNILGYSLQDIFITMRNSLIGSEGNNWDLMSWESLSGFALAGGTLAVAGGLSAFIAVSDFGPEVVYLILPALVVALIAVLVALVVLAARQAIIIILVILSPLAFVAYLLPNTEKWFTKWRELFFTMLFIFPAFSVIFGGSQLAATAIIHTADSINLIILGMLVQVAPLFITPLLIKLGGGLLGRIAGLVNDPNKGIIDRTRKFAEGRTQDARARRVENPKSWQLMRRNTAWRYDREKLREKRRSSYLARADTRWPDSKKGIKIDQYERETGDIKAIGEHEAETRYEHARVTNPRIRDLDIKRRTLEEKLTTAKNTTEKQWEDSASEDVIKSRILARISAVELEASKSLVQAQLNEIIAGKTKKLEPRFKVEGYKGFAKVGKQALIDSKVFASRNANAESHQQQVFAKALQDNPDLAEQAGGILKDGKSKALAAAKATIEHAFDEAVKNIQSTIEIPAGQVKLMRANLKKAIQEDNLAETIAYINKLGESANQGFGQLDIALQDLSEMAIAGTISQDTLTTIKQYVNANGTINPGAEHMGTWSRSKNYKTLDDVAADVGMWANMSPAAWAAQKQMAQERSLKAGGVDAKMARRILAANNSENVKGPVETELRKIIAADDAVRKRAENLANQDAAAQMAALSNDQIDLAMARHLLSDDNGFASKLDDSVKETLVNRVEKVDRRLSADRDANGWADQADYEQQESLEKNEVNATRARRILNSKNAVNVQGAIRDRLNDIVAADDARRAQAGQPWTDDEV